MGEVKKIKKRSTFRVFGIVIPSIKETNNIMGYAVLDVKNYKTRLFTIKQTYELLLRYPFDNAKFQLPESERKAVHFYMENNKLNADSDKDLYTNLLVDGETLTKMYDVTVQNILPKCKIFNTETRAESSETSLKKLMQFNSAGKVIGNKGVTILAEIEGSEEADYRVIDFNGKVLDIKEQDLIKIVNINGLPLLNATVVNKGKAYITPLKVTNGVDDSNMAKKGGFPVITKKDAEDLKKKSPAQKPENRKKHLDKITNKFFRSIIVMSTFKNWHVSDKFPYEPLEKRADDKFKRDIEIFVKEYVKVHHPTLFKYADEVYGTDKGDKDYEKLLAIVKASVFIETFILSGFSVERGYIGFNTDWEKSQIINKKFIQLIQKTGHKKLNYLFAAICYEQQYYKNAQSKTDSTLLNSYCMPYSKPYEELRDLIYDEYQQNKELKDGKSDVIKIYDTFLAVKDEKVINYMAYLPVINTIFNRTQKEKAKINKLKKIKLINLDMKTEKGAREIGYCFSIEGGNNGLLFPLRDLNDKVTKEIQKRKTCLGDLIFAAKVFEIIEEESQLSYGSKIKLESIMIILAIYNLELAEYLAEVVNKQKGFKLIDLNLSEINEEEFSLQNEDNIFYQSGGKFNKSVLLKNQSWCGLSKMPGGLRTAIALSISEDIPYEYEEVLDYLYK